MTRLEAKALFEMMAKFAGGMPAHYALNIADDLDWLSSDADCRELANLPHIARNPHIPVLTPYTERMLATMRAILRNIDGIPWGIK